MANDATSAQPQSLQSASQQTSPRVVLDNDSGDNNNKATSLELNPASPPRHQHTHSDSDQASARSSRVSAENENGVVLHQPLAVTVEPPVHNATGALGNVESNVLEAPATEPIDVVVLPTAKSSNSSRLTNSVIEDTESGMVAGTLDEPSTESIDIVVMPSARNSCSSNSTSTHLVVLLHGLWGKGAHMGELAQNLRASGYQVLICTSYEGFGSCSGAELCAERAMGELDEMLMGMAGSCKYISVIAYSFGGK
jgi:hypothetical protein